MLAGGTVATGTPEERVPTADGPPAPVRRRVAGFRFGVGAITAGLAGFLLLRWFETLSRRYASLERS